MAAPLSFAMLLPLFLGCSDCHLPPLLGSVACVSSIQFSMRVSKGFSYGRYIVATMGDRLQLLPALSHLLLSTMGHLLYSLHYNDLAVPLSPELQEAARLQTELATEFGTRQFTRWSNILTNWWNVRIFEYIHLDYWLIKMQVHHVEYPLLSHAIHIRTELLAFVPLEILMALMVNLTCFLLVNHSLHR